MNEIGDPLGFTLRANRRIVDRATRGKDAMASHVPPGRMRKGKATEPIRARPAQAQRPRCPGAAAQLATIHRTLRGGAKDLSGLPVQTARNSDRSGLPAHLKAGVEALSGLAMDDVRVHRSSSEPAKLGALAYTKGTDIHLGPGQEEHLPHEAWHVVQQKRGRVSATAQMKGANVDVALEADADRMGEAAKGGVEANPTVALRRTAGPSPVIQKKVMHKTIELQPCPVDDPGCHSEIVEAYIADETEYVMRDSCSVLDKEIHLLDRNTYYVFGEKHGAPADERWNRDVTGWDSVDKLVEEDLVTPGFPPTSPRNVPGFPIVRGTRPFDSVTAQFLNRLIRVQNSITILCSFSDEALDQMESDPRDDFLDAMEFLTDAWFNDLPADEGIYTEWMQRIPNDPAIGARDNPAKASLAATLIKKYGLGFEYLRFNLHGLAVTTGVRPPDMVTSLLGLSASDYRDGLRRESAFIPNMVSDLVTLLPMLPEEAKPIGDLLLSQEDESDAAVDATFEARNRAMLFNLEGTRPPVLIKTGGDHVAAIAEWFGDAVVSLRRGLPLAKLTKRTEPPKPAKRRRAKSEK